jgi:hypothetical protein
MNSFNISKIKNNIINKHDLEDALQLLIANVEGSYLQYFATNIILDYFTLKDILDEKTNKIALKQDSELANAIACIEDTLSLEGELFTLKASDISEKLTTLKKYRDAIEKRVRVLTAYSDRLIINEYKMNRLESEFLDSLRTDETDEDFAGELIKYIFGENDNVVINERIKVIYSQLPVRMTKNRFCDIVGLSLEAFKGINEEQLRNYIEMLKDSFYPEGIEGYGELFPLIHEAIVTLDGINQADLTKETYEKNEEIKKVIAKSVEDSTSLYLFVVNLINELIGLLLCINKESVLLAKTSIEQFEQAIHMISKINQDKGSYYEEAEGILAYTEGVIEKLLENLYVYEGVIETSLIDCEQELQGLKLSGRFQNMSKMPILMSGSHFASLENEKQVVDVPVDIIGLARTKKDIADYMKAILEKEEKKNARARMASLFVILNVIHTSPEEVYHFILDSLIACKDRKEKLMCKRLIRSIMKESY